MLSLHILRSSVEVKTIPIIQDVRLAANDKTMNNLPCKRFLPSGMARRINLPTDRQQITGYLPWMVVIMRYGGAAFSLGFFAWLVYSQVAHVVSEAIKACKQAQKRPTMAIPLHGKMKLAERHIRRL